MKNTFQVADSEQTNSILDNLRALSTTFWRDQLAGVVLCITSLCRILDYFGPVSVSHIIHLQVHVGPGEPDFQRPLNN